MEEIGDKNIYNEDEEEDLTLLYQHCNVDEIDCD